jgi:hypothetical protein
LSARPSRTRLAPVLLALGGLAALAVLGCGSGSRTITVTKDGEPGGDMVLQDCLRAVYGTEGGEPGEVQSRAAECLGVEEAVVAENPLLNACLAVASGLRDPRRFAQRVDECRRAFENLSGGAPALP